MPGQTQQWIFQAAPRNEVWLITYGLNNLEWTYLIWIIKRSKKNSDGIVYPHFTYKIIQIITTDKKPLWARATKRGYVNSTKKDIHQ